MLALEEESQEEQYIYRVRVLFQVLDLMKPLSILQ